MWPFTLLLLLQPFYDPLSGITQVKRYQKDKLFWILQKQTRWGGSGISWTICKSFALRSIYALLMHWYGPKNNHVLNASISRITINIVCCWSQGILDTCSHWSITPMLPINLQGTTSLDSGFYRSRHDGVAVASALPYASHLHFYT